MFNLIQTPYPSSDGDVLKTFVTREPILLFSLRKNAKSRKKKKKLNKLLKALRKKLPDNFRIGAAVGGEDGFFDSVAQGLNELKGKDLIRSVGGFSVESLRKCCKKYSQEVKKSKKDSWLTSTLKKGGRKLRKYVRNIEFTAKNIEESSFCSEKSLTKKNCIWGTPEIEGKIISEKYSVKFKIIKLRNGKKNGLSITKNKIGVGNNTIYILSFKNQYVPLLSDIDKDIKRSIKVSRAEVYFRETGTNSNNVSQSRASTLFQDDGNLLCKQSGCSRNISEKICKSGKKRRCSTVNQDTKASNWSSMDVNASNNEDTKFHGDMQDEDKIDYSHRKRSSFIEDKDNKAPKRILTDVNASTLFQDNKILSHIQSAYPSKKNRKTDKERRCSSANQHTKASRWSHMDAKASNNEDTEFHSDMQDEDKIEDSYKKRSCSIEENKAPKRILLDVNVSTLFQDNEKLSPIKNGHSSEKNRKTGIKQRRCSAANEDFKASKRSHVDLTASNNEDTEFHVDAPGEYSQDKYHRKRRCSVTNEDSKPQKRILIDVNVPNVYHGNENLSHIPSGPSKYALEKNCKTGKKRRCSAGNQDVVTSKLSHIDVNASNDRDTEFLHDVLGEYKLDKLHRKWNCSIEDKDDKPPKTIHMDVNVTKNEHSKCFNDSQNGFSLGELDTTDKTFRCIPHQLINLMFRLDLSVLCLLRESLYKHKYPSLSVAFGDSGTDRFGDITLWYEGKSIHVKIECMDKYCTNTDISYVSLFNRNIGKRIFFMNNFFNSFVKHLFLRPNVLSNKTEYLLIYTNSGLELTGEMKLKSCRSRSFYPFEFDRMNIEEYGILKDFLFTNDDVAGRGFYQFSRNKATRKELLKHLKFSSSMQTKIKQRNISPKVEKQIKRSFLDKLIFAVNQPNREELNIIIKKEFSCKGKHDYIELQEKILSSLKTQLVDQKQENIVSEIIYSFSLLMFFFHCMFLNSNVFCLSYNENGCYISNCITVNFKGRTSYVMAVNAESDIGYRELFPLTTEKMKMKFSMNKCFTLFIEELEKGNDIRFFIIYTNKGLALTEENRFKKGRSRDFYPLKLNNIDFQKKKYKVLRQCSCLEKNGLYQFSQEEKSELLRRLKFTSSFLSKTNGRLSEEDKKEKKEIFLNKLIFAVNQPDGQELNNVLKNDIASRLDEIPYSYKELHEVALRWSESHELVSITKGKMEMLLGDIKSNRLSIQEIPNNIHEEIKFAKSVVGREGTPAFNKFVQFLVKGEGMKYLAVLKENEVNLTNISSILSNSRSSAIKAFRDLFGLLFDSEGNKTFYLKTLNAQEVNLSSISNILNGAGENGAQAFKKLYDLLFDAKGNKTRYLINLQEGIKLTSLSSILSGAGTNAPEAFKELFDLWFDAKGNKTRYLITLEDEGVKLSTMSGILSTAKTNAPKAFKELFNLWFDAKGNKTIYLNTLEDEGVNLSVMSGILCRTGANAAKAFQDLYDLWFDTKGNKTKYLKTLEKEGVNLANISSILHGAGVNATKAFRDLYDLWFDTEGNKTIYLKTLEDAGIKLSSMSSILSLSGINAAKAFQHLYDLWFDVKRNKINYLKTLEEEGVNLTNITGILQGSGSKARQAFESLFHLWFDVNGNKTVYLKTLEDTGIKLSRISSILHGASSRAGEAFKDLYDLWFDERGNKTFYLKALEDEGVKLSNISSILNGAKFNAAKAFKNLFNLWFDSNGNKTFYLKALEDEGVKLTSMSSILVGAGSKAAEAFKNLFDLWFDAKGNKTFYLEILKDEGIKLSNMSNILFGAGLKAAKAFEDLFGLLFDAIGRRTRYLKTLEYEGLNMRSMSRILSKAGANAAKSFEELFDLWFDAKGNKTPYLKTLEDAGVKLSDMPNVLYKAGSKAAKKFRGLFHQ